MLPSVWVTGEDTEEHLGKLECPADSSRTVTKSPCHWGPKAASALVRGRLPGAEGC